jgi:Domain of unknown function (DUF397)
MSRPEWRKSSRSDSEGGNCIEIAQIQWVKSSRSNSQGGDCVEVGLITTSPAGD